MNQMKPKTDQHSNRMPAGENMQHAAEDLRESLRETGANLREAAATVIPAAKETFEYVRDEVEDRAVSIEKMLMRRIRERPMNSMLIAAGVGLLLGLFMRRK